MWQSTYLKHIHYKKKHTHTDGKLCKAYDLAVKYQYLFVIKEKQIGIVKKGNKAECHNNNPYHLISMPLHVSNKRCYRYTQEYI